MLRFYHILVKKSTISLIIAVFWLFLPKLTCAQFPNDPKYTDQQKMWDRIGAPDAWDIGIGSKRTVVAIIDTGADTWHDDLRDNVWINPGEIPDNKIDDDRNGYVDDVDGWNFIEKNNNVRTSVFDDGSDDGAVNHGTVVAGLVGATGNNNREGTGINWQVQIMPLRAVNSNGSGSLDDVSDAVYYAINNGANVISLSLVTGEYDEGLRNVLYTAYQRGITIVAAAGNDATDVNMTPVYPACFDATSTENWIIGVGALNSKDQLSYFTNYGNKCIDLLAPGTLIYSIERFAPGYGYLKSFGGPWQGTSFATPLVAGSAALIKSARPDWNAVEINRALFLGAQQFSDLDYPQAVLFGRLNIGSAMALTVKGLNQDKTEQFVYSSSKQEIRRHSLTTKKTEIFARINGAEIKSVMAGDIDNDLKLEIIVLFKRDNYYYWSFYNSYGNFLYERGIDTSLYKGGQIGRAQFLEHSMDGGWYALEIYYPKTKKTKIFAFDKNGVATESLLLTGKIDYWTFNSQGVIVGKNEKKKSKITFYNWKGKKLQTIVQGSLVSDMVMVSNLDKDSQMAMLITQKNDSSIVLWEPDSQTTREVALTGKNSFRLYSNHWLGVGKQSLLAFSSKNGSYQVFDSALNPGELAINALRIAGE